MSVREEILKLKNDKEKEAHIDKVVTKSMESQVRNAMPGSHELSPVNTIKILLRNDAGLELDKKKTYVRIWFNCQMA